MTKGLSSRAAMGLGPTVQEEGPLVLATHGHVQSLSALGDADEVIGLMGVHNQRGGV
jgi:hypothetical protein